MIQVFRVGDNHDKGERAMKKSRFNEEQIIGILKQQEAGQKVIDLAREHGISEATIYIWKSKYGGMDCQ